MLEKATLPHSLDGQSLWRGPIAGGQFWELAGGSASSSRTFPFSARTEARLVAKVVCLCLPFDSRSQQPA